MKNTIICFDSGMETDENRANVYHVIYDTILEKEGEQAAEQYRVRVMGDEAETIERYLEVVSDYVYPWEHILYQAPSFLEIVFEAGENGWVAGGEMAGMDNDDLGDDWDAIEAWCEQNRREHEEGMEEWTQHYVEKKREAGLT